MVVEAGTLTPLCDDGKPWPSHETHEQQNVDMSCLPVGGRVGWGKESRNRTSVMCLLSNRKSNVSYLHCHSFYLVFKGAQGQNVVRSQSVRLDELLGAA